MQTITPHLKRLREQHKDNARQLQEETLALYREHGINPASGCVALLLQLPLLWALYAVLQHVVQLKPADIIAYVNTIAYLPALHLQQPWDTGFFGIPLGQSPSHLFPRFGILVFLIPVLTGLLQYFQSKLMFPATPPAEPKEKSTTADDFAQAFQKQSLYIFPVMIAFFSYSLPFGLSLYWNTFSVFGIIQQRQLQNVAKVPGSNTRAIPPKKTSRKK